jgi:hypothetical protein
MPNGTTQSLFLDEVKKRLPNNCSLADGLATVLSISRASAYRRMRGETVLSLDEVKIICDEYHVSLDSFLNSTSKSVSFQHWAVGHTEFTLYEWLKSSLANLDMISRFESKELMYSAKDMPVFSYFQREELAAFKMYFWMKTVLGYPQYQNQKFSPAIVPRELLALGRKIWDKYESIQSTELWSDEAVNVTLKQIAFCYDCGFFDDPGIAKLLCDQYAEIVEATAQAAEKGVKNSTGENFTLYRNEILIGDNILLFRTNERRVVFVAYNTMSVLTTDEPAFCQHIDHYISNLLNRSLLISTTGQRERNRFFNQIHEKIAAMKARFA